MPRYVAFLRGINVGGRVVKKEQLIEAFTKLGFWNIITVKQSGNVIFEASDASVEEMKGKIEGCLTATLGYEVPVFLRTILQLQALVQADPFKGQSSEGSSFLITFLTAPADFRSPLPITIPKSTAQLIKAMGTEVYSVTHGGGEGALPNPFVEKQLKTKATTRNLSIVKEIVGKFS
jgi:uncharacterized protein (DUF1697 family)